VGKVVSEIEFPQKRKDVPTASFVPLERMVSIADSLGYKTDSYGMGSGDKGHLVLRFSGLKQKTFSVNIPFIEVSVHTGEVVSGIGPLERYTR